ncbi:MAG: hypothetical protein R8M14_04790, partial [Ghiorsea sp.]
MSSLEPIESDENILNIIQKTVDVTAQGHSNIQASCSSAHNIQTNDLRFFCHHTSWSPLLLACVAAEGVQTLHLNGLENCASCPHQQTDYSVQTALEEYEILNAALAIKLDVKLEPLPDSKPIETENT